MPTFFRDDISSVGQLEILVALPFLAKLKHLDSKLKRSALHIGAPSARC